MVGCKDLGGTAVVEDGLGPQLHPTWTVHPSRQAGLVVSYPSWPDRSQSQCYRHGRARAAGGGSQREPAAASHRSPRRRSAQSPPIKVSTCGIARGFPGHHAMRCRGVVDV